MAHIIWRVEAGLQRWVYSTCCLVLNLGDCVATRSASTAKGGGLATIDTEKTVNSVLVFCERTKVTFNTKVQWRLSQHQRVFQGNSENVVSADQSWSETCVSEYKWLRETQIRAWSPDALQWRCFRAHPVASFAVNHGFRTKTQRLQTSDPSCELWIIRKG